MASPDEHQTRINAVKTYLEREFPGATVSHIPSGSWFNQTVETLRIDCAEGRHILKVTRNCLTDTPDITNPTSRTFRYRTPSERQGRPRSSSQRKVSEWKNHKGRSGMKPLSPNLADPPHWFSAVSLSVHLSFMVPI